MRTYPKYIPLILILSLHFLGWIILKPVYPHSDDYCYAAHAHHFLHQHFELTFNKFQNRFWVYVPTAIIFYFFGINTYTISLWTLIASCLTIVVVYLIVNKIVDKTAATVASFLIAINSLQITYSIALFPDLIVSLYAILAVLILYKGREVKNNLLYAIAFPIILLIGLFTKETILLLAPFILLIIVKDLIKKEHVLFWRRTFPMMFLAMVFFFVFYWIITGDSFHRIKSMIDFKDNYLMPDDDAAKLRAAFPTNIFIWLNGELGYIFLLLLSFPAFLFIHKIKDSFCSFITCYSLILFLEFIILFHTTKYGAVFLQDRIWMPLIAPLSIVTAITIKEATWRTLWILFTGFLLYALLNSMMVSMGRELLYLSFPIIIGGIILFKLNRQQVRASLLLFPLFILYLNFIYGNSNYRVARLNSSNIIKEQIDIMEAAGDKNIVLTEGGLTDDIKIYNGFKEYQNIRFMNLDKVDSVSEFKNVYCMINSEETTIPKFITEHPERWKCIYDNHHLLLYKRN